MVMSLFTVKDTCWDTCICIDFIKQVNPVFEYTKELFEKAQNGKGMIVISSLVMVESSNLGDEHPRDKIQKVLRFMNSDGIEEAQIDRNICELALEVRSTEKVTQFDAIHIATALFHNIPVLLTHDGLKKKKEKPLLPLDNFFKLKNGKPLRILTPEQFHRIKLEESENIRIQKNQDKDKHIGQNNLLELNE